jgi:hypothetical protein
MAVVEFGGILRTVQSFTADANLLRAAATGMKTSSVNPHDKEPKKRSMARGSCFCRCALWPET